MSIEEEEIAEDKKIEEIEEVNTEKKTKEEEENVEPENEEDEEEEDDINEGEEREEKEEEENEISDEMFKLKEEQIKSHEKIKIVDDLDDANTNNNIDGEKTPLDRSMKLYNNNIQIKKPKFYGKIKSLFYLFNKPIFMSAESSKLQ